MKKLLLIGSIVLVLGLLIAGLTAPIFAHGPDDGGATTADEETWETMHEACEDGDWEAMAEAAEELHGEDFDHMPCHDEDDHAPANHWGGMGGHMGRGMMGW
jgi:hypothetical protein